MCFLRQAFLYSLKHEIPLVAYCSDRCLTLFDHPLVEAVHSVYCEPKVPDSTNLMPSPTTSHRKLRLGSILGWLLKEVEEERGKANIFW